MAPTRQAARLSRRASTLPGLTVSVNYASSNGTAIAGSDYLAVSGTLTFAPGVTSRSFQVPILNDTIDEPDETVRLTMFNQRPARGSPAPR